MRQWRSLTKLADIAESMSTSPLPQVAIPTTPAPTSRGPSNHKQLPETVDNVSRVNTGVPVSSNAGAFEQKSISPPPVSTKVAFGVEDQMAIGSRPLVTELVKSAMAGSASRVRLADEYSRQTKLASEGHEEPDGDEKKDKKEDKKEESAGKEAQAALPSDYALKLASAVEFIVKKASPVEPGSGPNALQVSQAIDGKPTSQPGGQGHGHAQPPMHPGVQKGLSTEQAPTMLDNTLHNPPGGGGTQTTAMTAGHGKTASLAESNLSALKKLASPKPSIVDRVRAKVAEDAINPAQISAGAAVPPQTSAAGEAGGEPVGGAPQGPSSLIASNEAARNFKRKDAYGPRKGELAAYFSEPALSSQTDKTLEQAFANTANAGTKLGSANMDRMAKTAAARAVIQSLVDDARATR